HTLNGCSARIQAQASGMLFEISPLLHFRFRCSNTTASSTPRFRNIRKASNSRLRLIFLVFLGVFDLRVEVIGFENLLPRFERFGPSTVGFVKNVQCFERTSALIDKGVELCGVFVCGPFLSVSSWA